MCKHMHGISNICCWISALAKCALDVSFTWNISVARTERCWHYHTSAFPPSHGPRRLLPPSCKWRECDCVRLPRLEWQTAPLNVPSSAPFAGFLAGAKGPPGRRARSPAGRPAVSMRSQILPLPASPGDWVCEQAVEALKLRDDALASEVETQRDGPDSMGGHRLELHSCRIDSREGLDEEQLDKFLVAQRRHKRRLWRSGNLVCTGS